MINLNKAFIEYNKRIQQTMPPNYIKTLIYNNRDFDVYFDDNGQCFYIKWMIGDKEYECCCGNYSGCYETEIIEIAEEIEFQTK